MDDLKAPERPCKLCGTVIPAQPSGPGRPRVFCSTDCRRSWHYGQEKQREAAAMAARRERARYEWDVKVDGKREADRRAKKREAERRAKKREARNA